jgi:hypothetical protein
MRLRVNPVSRGAARPAYRCQGLPAATPIGNRCPRRRQAGLRPVRPRWYPRRRRRLRFTYRRPVNRRRQQMEGGDGEKPGADRDRDQPDRHPCRRNHCGGNAVVEGRQQGHLRRLLRQLQRSVHRRRGAHPRCRRRHRGRDRTAAAIHQGHVLGRLAVSGPRRRSGGDPVAVVGQRTGHSARPCLLRRSETRIRRGYPARAHRSSGRVGRLPPAVGEAHRLVAAADAGRAKRGGRLHQQRRGQPAR